MHQSKYSRAHRALLAQRAAGLRSSLTPVGAGVVGADSRQAAWGMVSAAGGARAFHRRFAAVGARVVVEKT
jgi:hypothetical protein